MTLRATYRLQFHKGFPFSAAAGIAPYLAQLGVSHVYASPIQTARAGSQHGYDVIDHARINPELGGDVGFRDMCSALQAYGLGIILDIVPNHMAVGGGDNLKWLDVLRNGEASPFASWFDINFSPRSPALRGKVLLPFLEAPYRRVLAAGKLVLREDGTGGYAVHHHEHVFPLRPEDGPEIRARGVDHYRDSARLDAILQRQHYRLAWWRSADRAINWRRFFTITSLAGLSVEQDDVFDAVHQLPLDLFATGLVDGLRVDHVDGLSAPGAYCRRLRRCLDERLAQRPPGRELQNGYLIVEKILAPSEALRTDWGVDGTTGYDFMNDVSALQHAAEGAEPLAALWSQISGRSGDFDTEELRARQEIAAQSFAGQIGDLAQRLVALDTPQNTSSLQDYRAALLALLSEMRVYRSYRPDTPGGEWEGEVSAAFARAALQPGVSQLALRSIERQQNRDFLRRLHQATAPVAAKAVEDTAFYRYGRLLSRNDVGFSPGQFAMTVRHFHERNIVRRQNWPKSLLATATHDHKRGEDIRARLAVLSYLPDRWQSCVADWFAYHAPLRPNDLSLADEYQLYQMIVGAWPLSLTPQDGPALAAFRDRLQQWQIKAIREAKLATNWTSPAPAYEKAAADFLELLLDGARAPVFIAQVSEFVREIAPSAALNSLTQTALKLTIPGIPDIYQGTEAQDLSLVDPDNRRPVDYQTLAATLHKTHPRIFHNDWRDGNLKLALTARLLALRRFDPKLFREGDYIPLDVRGQRRDGTIAFARRAPHASLIVSAPIHTVCLAAEIEGNEDWWMGSALDLKPLEEVEQTLGREPLTLLYRQGGDTRDILSADAPAWLRDRGAARD